MIYAFKNNTIIEVINNGRVAAKQLVVTIVPNNGTIHNYGIFHTENITLTNSSFR